MYEEKQRVARSRIKRVTSLAIFSNISLFLFKLIVGLLAGSVALIADSIHSLSDTATDLGVLLGIHIGSKGPDKSHPYGHGRAETFSAIIIALFLGSGGNVSTEDLKAVQAKVERLGRSVSSLEGLEDKLAQIEKQGKSLQQSIVRTDRSGITLAKRLDKLSKRIDALQKKVASFVPRSVAKSKPALPAKGRYHLVRSGESYYRIAQKYGMTVDELLRINNLKKKQVIYPGQRLLIAPAGQ